MEKAATFDSRKVNMVVTLILWTMLCVACMVLMLYVALHKTIVIADEIPGQLALSVADGQEIIVGSSHSLTFAQRGGNEGSIRIPLSRNIDAEDVMVENRYLNQELWVYIQGAEESFYDEKAITGDISPVVYGYCEGKRGGVILKIQMDGVWEYYSTLEYDTSVSDSGNSMVISFRKPHEIYSQVVVIDPMGGGSEKGSLYRGYAEKTLALQIARTIPEKLEYSDIRLYFTRLEDVDVAEETRIELAKAVNADMYVRIAAGADEDASSYGVAGFYNEEYYIPGVGNVQLADALTRNVTIASSNRAVGIFPAEEDSILQRLTVPAAQINVGYLTNEQEAALLGREFYRDKLAQGIADAIEEVYNSRKAELGDNE